MTWTLFEGDCFDYFHLIKDGSIDMILCDLPYGTTQCKWDTPLPLKELWEQYERVIKPNGAIVLTGSQPFTSHLVMSNPKLFKYSWVWDKVTGKGHLVSKIRPLQQTEDICVFGKKKINYYPIMTPQKRRKSKEYSRTEIMGGVCNTEYERYSEWKFPKNLLTFSWSKTHSLHPTEKPVKLFEYLIKTYTNEGDLVLDNCAGSGTTGVACENLNRNSILMEKEPEYCQIIRNRLMEVTSQKKLDVGVRV